MSSPFRYFRKHSKAFMAVAAVMCMFLFVFASGTGGGGSSRDNQRSASATVATWDGGKITEGELGSLVQQRLITDEFLRMVFAQGGGQTGYDLPTNVPALLLASRDSAQLELTAVETELFADLAMDAGMSVSEAMINRYIQEMGLRRVDSDDILGILANLGDGNARSNEAIVFSTLRKLLLAYFYSQSYADAGFVVLPEQRWEDWRRVNERIALQVATLPVESFLSEVPEPTEAQLKGLFEQYQDFVPHRYASVGGRELPIAEPGFAEPRRVALQYLVGSVAERTETLLASVTDEEIADYYERNKRLDYVKEEDPLGDLDFDNDAPLEGDPAAEPPAEDEPVTDDLGDPDATETPTDELNPEAPPAPADPPAEAATVETPAEAPTDESSAEPPADAAPSEDAPAGAEVAPADADQSSTQPRRSPFRLVALQADASAEAGDEPAAETEPSTNTATVDAPAEPAEGEAAEEGAETAASGNPPPVGDEPSASEPANSVDDTAATDELSPEGSAADADEAAGDDAAADEKPVEYIPLEDVREDIRRAIAREKAVDELEQQIGEAAAKLQSEYNQYGRQLIEARELEKSEPKPPARLTDLAWLAEETGLKLQTTEPLTDREMFETSVGKAVDDQGGRVSVTQAAFLDLEPFEPYLAKELEGDWYLVTKVSDSPRRVPKFDEARDRVAMAWKRIEAAKLAEKKADELAKEAETASESFEEFFKSKGYEVIPQTALFSWRSFPLGPGMGAPAELSAVPELKNVGPEFMEAAFQLDGNTTDALLNYDHTAAYAMRLHSRQYTPEELRKLFLAEDNVWPGRYDMLQEHQRDFRQLINRRIWEDFANFKFDEEWERRRDERLAEQN